MPVLPLIDLLILLGWTSLLVAFVLKFLTIAMSWPLTIMSLTPQDFLLGAVSCLIFALTLAARTWVKANEPRLVARRRVGSYGLERLDEAPSEEEAPPHGLGVVHAQPAAAGAGRTKTELATGGR